MSSPAGQHRQERHDVGAMNRMWQETLEHKPGEAKSEQQAIG